MELDRIGSGYKALLVKLSIGAPETIPNYLIIAKLAIVLGAFLVGFKGGIEARVVASSTGFWRYLFALIDNEIGAVGSCPAKAAGLFCLGRLRVLGRKFGIGRAT